MDTVVDRELQGALPSDPAATFVPRFPAGLLRNITVDVALPWAAIQLLTRAAGMSSAAAVAIAALFPVVSMVVGWRRRRRIDFIGLLVLVTLAGAIAVTLATQDVRYALLKPAAGAVVFAIACLATLGRPAPLMFYFARQASAGDDQAKFAAWTARLERPGFRRAMRRLTLVWGLTFLGKAALWTGAVLLLSPTTTLLVAPVFSVGVLAVLMAWTIRFARRRAAAASEQ
jgi:hypothetical protein